MIRFELPSAETNEFQDSARRFVERRYDWNKRGEAFARPEHELPAYWDEIAGLGWLAACTPENAGGLGLFAKEMVPFLEVLGAGLVLEPVVPVAMHCAVTLAAALPEKRRHEVLDPILTGERIEVIVEHKDKIKLISSPGASEMILSGETSPVIGAAAASFLWVIADLDGAPALVPVEADRVERKSFRLADGQAAARVIFRDIRCSTDDIITRCEAALDHGRDMRRVGQLAEMSGLIDALYSDTLAFVTQREQFGRPIGKFQVVQHRMADLFILREEAKSMVRLAAEAMDNKDQKFRARLISAAWLKVTGNARKVLRDAIQLHGAMGMTDDLRLGHLVKRLLVLIQIGGSQAAQLARFRDAA